MLNKIVSVICEYSSHHKLQKKKDEVKGKEDWEGGRDPDFFLPVIPPSTIPRAFKLLPGYPAV